MCFDISTLVVGKRYIVTKESDDGTFLVGDHIWLEPDGAICCREAQGWIPSDEAAEAFAGAEVKVDVEWIALQKAKLLKKLEEVTG